MAERAFSRDIVDALLLVRFRANRRLKIDPSNPRE
jgi:hypothetical protein